MLLRLLRAAIFASVTVVFAQSVDDFVAPSPFDVDVVIIGAGFAGLTVASLLHREGISVVVLEALDRVGGKAEARVDQVGRLVDTGAQFVNDEMIEVLALAEQAGAMRSTVNGSTDHDSHLIRPSYLAQLNESTTAEVEELQSWFPATLHSLAALLAAPLVDVIRLDCRVRAIHLHDASVDVVALDQVWHAREIVVAAPPSAYFALGFTPPLPNDIVDAAASFVQGTVVKYLLRFERPFWLDRGRNGTGQFLGPPGLYFTDASLADAATLVGFVGGTTAVEWTRHTPAQRRDAIVHHASVAFGHEALRPTSVLERVWAPDELGAGGYSNVQTTHAPDAAHALAVGLPLVTFASTELATRFPGYVEGAIVAGQAAAAQVMHRLRHV